MTWVVTPGKGNNADNSDNCNQRSYCPIDLLPGSYYLRILCTWSLCPQVPETWLSFDNYSFCKNPIIITITFDAPPQWFFIGKQMSLMSSLYTLFPAFFTIHPSFNLFLLSCLRSDSQNAQSVKCPQWHLDRPALQSDTIIVKNSFHENGLLNGSLYSALVLWGDAKLWSVSFISSNRSITSGWTLITFLFSLVGINLPPGSYDVENNGDNSPYWSGRHFDTSNIARHRT